VPYSTALLSYPFSTETYTPPFNGALSGLSWLLVGFWVGAELARATGIQQKPLSALVGVVVAADSFFAEV
jgi:hypothetical protein